jgi:hypothetical protein
LSGRCHVITLPDCTKATVRSQKRGWKPSPADIEMIMALRRELLQERMRYAGGDPDCNHENDGEGTCLGCGAQV